MRMRKTGKNGPKQRVSDRTKAELGVKRQLAFQGMYEDDEGNDLPDEQVVPGFTVVSIAFTVVPDDSITNEDEGGRPIEWDEDATETMVLEHSLLRQSTYSAGIHKTGPKRGQGKAAGMNFGGSLVHKPTKAQLILGANLTFANTGKAAVFAKQDAARGDNARTERETGE